MSHLEEEERENILSDLTTRDTEENNSHQSNLLLKEEVDTLLAEVARNEHLTFRKGLRLIYVGNILNNDKCRSVGYEVLDKLGLLRDSL